MAGTIRMVMQVTIDVSANRMPDKLLPLCGSGRVAKLKHAVILPRCVPLVHLVLNRLACLQQAVLRKTVVKFSIIRFHAKAGPRKSRGRLRDGLPGLT